MTLEDINLEMHLLVDHQEKLIVKAKQCEKTNPSKSLDYLHDHSVLQGKLYILRIKKASLEIRQAKQLRLKRKRITF